MKNHLVENGSIKGSDCPYKEFSMLYDATRNLDEAYLIARILTVSLNMARFFV